MGKHGIDDGNRSGAVTGELIPSLERYADCVADAVVLNAKHWKELYGNAGYRANHGGIVDMEKAGMFLYFTLRDSAKILAGHAAFFIFNSPVYGIAIAMDAFYYVLPEYRGRFGMSRLLKFAAEYMNANGVGRILVSHKTDNDIGALIERANFQKSGTLYCYSKVK